jgi:hypothetical protein
MATNGCIHSPDIICYTCGQYVIKKQRQNIRLCEKTNYAYFGMKVGYQNKNHGLHTRTAAFMLKNQDYGLKVRRNLYLLEYQ